MKELAILLRAMQMFSHSAHHLMARTPFHSDHEFFSEVYQGLDDDYDSVIERMIGLSGEEGAQLQAILVGVSSKLVGAPSIGVKENALFYQHQLKFEMELCTLIAQIIQSTSPGTEQLIGEICNKSEMRQYKIKQRIKK